MSINEIKDIKKLQTWLKQNIEQVRYLKECCENAGKELEKNSFAWDGKEKNLVIQALELNQRYERKEQECEKLKERASIAEDNFACEVQARLYHQNEWLKFSKECDRFRKVLDEIEKYAKENDEMLQGYHHEWANNRQILEIINKAKGQ